MPYKKELVCIGWREWVSFPKLKIPAIKAKIDTGARTSSIHTFRLETYSERGVSMVRFGVHPLQQRTDIEIFCSAQVVDERLVTDSGGHREKRYVIMTPIKVGDKEWLVEVTLAKRDNMQFRMLLGRTAMAKKLMVDPHASYRMGEDPDYEYPALIRKTPKKQIEKTAKKQIEKTAKKQIEKTAKKQIEKTPEKQIEKTAKKQIEKTAKEQIEKTAKKQTEKTAKKQTEKLKKIKRKKGNK